MRKAIAVVALIVVISLGAAWYLRHRGYLANGNAVERTPEVLLRLENVHAIGRSKGQKTWSVEAKRADIGRSRIDTTLYDIKDGIIYQDEKPAAKLSAKKAVYNEADKSFEVSGGIKVKTNDGTEIYTTTARYNSWKDMLSCPEKVALKTKKSNAAASSLEANLKTNEIDAKGLRMKVDLGELEKMLDGQTPGKQGAQ